LNNSPYGNSGPQNPNPGDLAIVGLALGGLWLLWQIFAGKKKVFISYDHSEDARYKHLLGAWNKNDKFKFELDNRSPRLPIDSEDARVVKASLTKKMKDAEYMLVIVGDKTNRSKWVNWEVERALQADIHLKLAVVKIDRNYESPAALLRSGAAWAYSFTEQNVIEVLNRAATGKQTRPVWA
jgi:MTH538 TIR-like domain (DUF1863)